MKRPLSPLTTLTAGLVTALAVSQAEARTIKIVTADSLELRNVDDQELVVIAGENLDVRVDDDIVKASRVEFNRTARTLALIGDASYYTAKDGQTMKGKDLVIDLASESATGEDVIISDANLEVRGKQIERAPGQLRAEGGYFTTCARCGNTSNDYAFKAERLIVYPGDRLVAYKAQLLLAEHPVLYLPVVVLPLNDKARQPRLMMGSGGPDGFTVEADLPFSIGGSTLGTSMLRYYGNRKPRVGLGVDLQSYAPLPMVDRADLYLTAFPKPIDSKGQQHEGYDIDLNLAMKGRVPVPAAGRELNYTLSAKRKDTGLTDTDPERGVTKLDFGVKGDFERLGVELNVRHRLGGEEPKTAVTEPYRKLEVVLDPKVISLGRLNADFKVTAGRYTAAVNPQAISLKDKGPNITTTRVQQEHKLDYTAPLWQDAELQLTNDFIGRHYGTGGKTARTVDLKLAGQFTQRWAQNNTFSVRQEYSRYEGTSPFAFDALNGRRLNAPLSLNLNTVPVKGTTFSVSYSRDPFLKKEDQLPLTVKTTVNRAPLTLSTSLAYKYSLQEFESWDYDLTLGDPDSKTLKLIPATPELPATPTTPAQPARPAYYQRSSAWPIPRLTLGLAGGFKRETGDKQGGLQPITAKATVTGEVRTNLFTVSAVYDPRKEKATERLTQMGVSYTMVSTRDAVINPVTVSGSETFYFQDQRLSGDAKTTWRGLQFGTKHDLYFTERPNTTDSGQVSFSVGSVEGKATNWQLTYGGPYDLRRRGFTTPTLTGSLTVTQPGQSLNASATVNMPGLDQKHTGLANASMSGEWQRGRLALSGRAVYTRTYSGTGTSEKRYDTLSLEPVRVGLGLGKGERPGAYVTAALRQKFEYIDGVRQNPGPLTPVLGLTIDRCCWVLQAEVDLVKRSYRLAIGLPGELYPLYQMDKDGASVPLLPGAGQAKTSSTNGSTPSTSSSSASNSAAEPASSQGLAEQSPAPQAPEVQTSQPPRSSLQPSNLHAQTLNPGVF